MLFYQEVSAGQGGSELPRSMDGEFVPSRF